MLEIKHHFWKDAALLAGQLVASLIAFMLAIAIIVLIIRKPARRYKPVDLSVFKKLDNYTSPAMTKFMLFVTFLGKHQFLVPANLFLLFYFLFIRRHTWFSVRVAAISLSSLVLMLVLKQLFRRKRPLAPLLKSVRGLSFPSGHAIMAVTFYGLLIYIIHQTTSGVGAYLLIACLVMLIFFIGFSRIYLRVHYASDVSAGFIIGFLWLLISLLVVSKVEEVVEETVRAGGNKNSCYVQIKTPPTGRGFSKSQLYWLTEQRYVSL